MALAALGCSPPKVQLGEGPREYVATDYDAVLRHWTREGQLLLFDRLDNVLTATATYESWDFRWAYVVRYAEDYRLTVQQRRDVLQRALAATRDTHQFYVALYAQKHTWSDLNDKEPAWILRLIDDHGHETSPSEIESIKRPGAIELTYFPYTTPWRRAYRIRFPRVDAKGAPTIDPKASWFGLRFAGAQGNDALIWYVDDQPSADPSPGVARRASSPGSPATAAR